MRQFSFVLFFALVAYVSANSGYRYQNPQPAPLPAPVAAYSQPPRAPVYSQPAPGPISVPSRFVPSPVSNYIAAPQPIQQNINVQQPQLVQQQQVSYQPQQQPINYQQPLQQPQQQIVYQQPQQQNVQRPSIITKDIYIHSAPEETEELNLTPQLDNVPVRKNYRIVFIKAPTTNLRHTVGALRQAQATNEEKTVIYVLSKKPDLTEVQQQLQVTQSEAKVHKPEVYFIKYKTQEEAQRAQQEIQAQYDALGGATHISDEGIAPITNVGSLNLGGGLSHGGGFSQDGGLSLGGGFSQGGGNIIHQQPQIINQGGQQQSYAQQSFQTSGGAGLNFGSTGPSSKYLPAKTTKK